MNILRIFTTLILFTIPIGELIRINFGNNIILKPLDLLTVITATLFLLTGFGKYKKLTTSNIKKPLIIFSSIALLSLLININRLEPIQALAAFFYWLRWISYAAIYFVILNLNKSFIIKIPIFLFLDGVAILFLGYVQYFIYPNLRNLYYLGWDEHNYRMFSVFLDPNFLGVFLTLFLLTGIVVADYSFVKRNKYIAFLLYLTSALTAVAIFLTFSRSAILMLFSSICTYLILINKKRLLIILVGIIGGFILILSPAFDKENTNLFRTTSSLARIDSYNDALDIISEHPIIGVGFNAYRYTLEEHGFTQVGARFENHAEAGVDSSLLFVTATTGIIGITMYLSIWLFVLKRAYMLHKTKESTVARVVICSTVGLFVSSFFINSLFFPVLMLWMWIMIGIMERKDFIQH